MPDYSRHYSETAYRKKIGKMPKLDINVLGRAKKLHQIIRMPDVPGWAKLCAVAALGYFVWPIDAVPDLLPGIGYSDDLIVMGIALLKLGMFLQKSSADSK